MLSRSCEGIEVSLHQSTNIFYAISDMRMRKFWPSMQNFEVIQATPKFIRIVPTLFLTKVKKHVQDIRKGQHTELLPHSTLINCLSFLWSTQQFRIETSILGLQFIPKTAMVVLTDFQPYLAENYLQLKYNS